MKLKSCFNSIVFFSSLLILTACGGSDNPPEADTTPNSFSFQSQVDVALATAIDSESVTITGIDGPSPISVVNGSYSINSGGFTNAAGTVTNNQSVVVRLTSSDQNNTAIMATLTIGGVSGNFSATTLAADTTPDVFTLLPISDAALDTQIDSAAITITGINAATPISITNGSYGIAGGSFSTNEGTIGNNQSVVVRVTSSNTNSTAIESVLTIGGVSATFTVTTLDDTSPDTFSFNAKTDVPVATDVDSDPITITGISVATPISVTNGSYSVNGGNFITTDTTITDGQSVVLRATSSAQYETSVETSLVVGNEEAVFSITTSKAFLFGADDGKTGMELWVTDGSENGTNLVKDINTKKAESDLGNFVEMNGELFFIANDGKYGSELRKLNVATGKNEVVKNINIAPNITGPNQLITLGNTLFFVAVDEDNRSSLWKSDGTESGTVAIKALISVASLTVVDNTLFFTARDPGAGGSDGLWKTDGTEPGTVIVKDFSANNDFPQLLTEVANKLFFVSKDNVSGEELWVSDGTGAGTFMVKDIETGLGDSSPQNLIASGNILYFRANTTANGRELWKSDGTEIGTVLVKDVSATTIGSSFATPQIAVNGIVYFEANFGELWKSDGTDAGTVLVKELAQDPAFGFIVRMFEVNNTVFISAFVDGSGTELWKTDGTEVGTLLIKDINPGTASSNPFSFTSINNKLYFSANDGVNGRELWTSDGTDVGTTMVKDIYLGGESSELLLPKFTLNGVLYFPANDGISGREMWKTDGTEAGTQLVEDINQATQSSREIFISRFGNVNGIHYFPANDGDNGLELWKSDGTEAGTMMVKDIDPAGNGMVDIEDYIRDLVAFGDKVYFPASNGVDGLELWVSDGTEAGTIMLEDINLAGNSTPSALTVVGNELFFVANDGAFDGLWKTDGTSTTLVKNITARAGGSFPSIFSLFAVNNIVYFSANDGVNGRELWKSDGSEAGTVMVKDINPGSDSSSPTDFGVIGNILYFGTLGGTPGLWKTDGTEAGTVLLKNLELDDVTQSTAIGDTLYMLANDGVSGFELWKSDGTEAGTVIVRDINPGAGDSTPVTFAVLNEKLYFSANDGLNGEELWMSDGTEAGTVLVKDIYSGTQSSEPDAITIGNRLYIFATSELGKEIWTSDGTEAGTVILKDTNEGNESGSYFPFGN